jgi:hypothetical protein
VHGPHGNYQHVARRSPLHVVPVAGVQPLRHRHRELDLDLPRAAVRHDLERNAAQAFRLDRPRADALQQPPRGLLGVARWPEPIDLTRRQRVRERSIPPKQAPESDERLDDLAAELLGLCAERRVTGLQLAGGLGLGFSALGCLGGLQRRREGIALGLRSLEIGGLDVERDTSAIYLLNTSVSRFIETFLLLDQVLGQRTASPSGLGARIRELDPEAFARSEWREAVEYIEAPPGDA